MEPSETSEKKSRYKIPESFKLIMQKPAQKYQSLFALRVDGPGERWFGCSMVHFKISNHTPDVEHWGTGRMIKVEDTITVR